MERFSTRSRPRLGVELDPVVPALLGREGGEVDAAGPRVEGLAPRLDVVPGGAHPLPSARGRVGIGGLRLGSCQRHGLAGLDVGVLVGQQPGQGAQRRDRDGPEPRRERAPAATSDDAGPEEAARSARGSSPGRPGARGRWGAASVTSPATSEQVGGAARRPAPSRAASGAPASNASAANGSSAAAPASTRLDDQVRRQQRALPEVARLGLGEQVGGVDGGHHRQRERRRRPATCSSPATPEQRCRPGGGRAPPP